MQADVQGGADMEAQELRRLRPALRRFARKFDGCFSRQATRQHLRTYMSGQLGPLERKSIEPMALEANVSPRTLQEFLGHHRWDEDLMRRRLGGLTQRDHAHAQAIGVIDGTSVAKKGDKTPGVNRQYCGSTGKIDNGVVTVHLGYVVPGFHTLVDSDLYLPQEWAEDRARRHEAGIPDEVVYRPKWRIALDLVERTLAAGVSLRWLTCDEEYGCCKAFRDRVAELGLTYVVEIPQNMGGWTHPVRVEQPSSTPPSSVGRPRQHARLAAGEPLSREVRHLWPRGGPSFRTFRVKDTQKGPVVWEARETRFYPRAEHIPGDPLRLIVAREVLTGEIKYFLSNATMDVPLENLLTVAFSRWNVERLFEDAKGEVGLDHFEVRTYKSVIRHLVLTNLSLYFLAEQTQRLRGEKSLVVDLPGAQGDGSPARSNEITA